MTDSPAKNMRTCLPRFNTFLTPILGGILIFLLLGALGTGGEAAEPTVTADPKATKKKPAKKERHERSLFRMHLESAELPGLSTGRIKVLRSSPMNMVVQREQFLDERDVQQARLISTTDGGFMIAIQMNTHGQLMLQLETTANRGKRIAVSATWTEARWLAAPQITRTIEDGIYMFTPDCSREEADRIIRGLNNVAIEVKNQVKPGKKKKVEEDDESIKRFAPVK